MKYRLTEDHYSYVKKGKLYGKKGDTVELIADHGHFLLVSLKGNGFSIPISKVEKIK